MISAAVRPSIVVLDVVRNTYGCRFSGAVSWSVFTTGTTKTILFSFAIGETAGPSADVSVPNKKLDIFAQDQVARDPDGLVGVAFGIADDELDLAAEDAALRIDFVRKHLRALERRLADQRTRTRQDHRIADPNWLLCLRRFRDEDGSRRQAATRKVSTQRIDLLSLLKSSTSPVGFQFFIL